MTYATAPVTDEKLNAFLKAAQSKIAQYWEQMGYTQPQPTLAPEQGKRYIRIVSVDAGNHKSAWAFVEAETGLILKPASWKVPAKHARGTVHTETHGGEFVGPYGPAYLRG